MKANKLGLILLCGGWIGTAAAQSYSVDWFKIAGSGGSSTGGVYSVSGTLGQHEAGGPLAGGAYTLVGGFWAMPLAVQVTNAPTLKIVAAGPGFATLTWLPTTPGFVLQQSESLTPAAWTNAPSGGTNPVTVPVTLPVRFYRLNHP